MNHSRLHDEPQFLPEEARRRGGQSQGLLFFLFFSMQLCFIPMRTKPWNCSGTGAGQEQGLSRRLNGREFYFLLFDSMQGEEFNRH